MKKLLLSAALIAASFTMTAQVGVGTTTPSAALDVVSTGSTNATKALEINNSAGTEMVTVLDDGRVGVGTATPLSKLSVQDGNIGIQNSAASASTSRYIQIADDNDSDFTNNWLIGNFAGSNANNLQFRHRAAGAITRNSADISISATTGFVGVMTSDPVSPLDLRHDANVLDPSNTFRRLVVFGSDGTVGNPDIHGVSFGYNDAGDTGSGVIASILRSDMAFWTATGLTLDSYQERMRLTKAGNFGIGTTDPKSTFDLRSDGTPIAAGSVFNRFSTQLSKSNISGILMGYSTIEQTGIISANSGRNLAFWAATNSSSPYVERMRLTNNGNFGIGTTTPTTKLAVVGLPTFANEAAAASLNTGDFYKTATGQVMVKL